MSQDDEILQTFFYVLSRYVELNNLKTVKDFFTLSESNKIDKIEFGKGLQKLGYEDNSLHFEFLFKKYQNFHVKTLINLDVIIQEYEEYKNDINKSKFNNNNNKNDIDNIDIISSPELELKSGSEFRINENNFNNTTNSKLENFTNNTNTGFGVTKYMNTPSNFGNTNNMAVTNKKNIYVEDNDEFNFSSGRRNRIISNKNVKEENLDDQIYTAIENDNNNSINSRAPTFGQKNNQILQKLEILNKQMMDELQENHSYIKITLYEKFYNYYITQKNEMENELKKRDKLNTKFLSPENFEDFLESILILNEDEKKIIMMDIVTNNSGNFSYQDFLEKVKNFDKNEILNQIRNYNLNYNDYIVNLRKFVKENQVDIKKNWINVFQSVPKADLNGFDKLLATIGFNFCKEEVEYIFNKISEDGNVIIFKNFDNLVNRIPPSRESIKRSQIEKLTTTNFKSENNFNNTNNNFNRSIRDQDNFNELKNKNTQESSNIILQRLNETDKKIYEILNKMQNFKTFKLYENLSLIFKPMGGLPENYFMQMDMRRQGYLTETEFNMVLAYLKIDLNDEQRNLIFQSLNNKTTNQQYSYREFLTRVISYNPMELVELTRKVHQFFNDYVVELRTYLKENNIDILQSWESIFNKNNQISYDQFVVLLQNLNFNLSHVQEYKYLFQILSQDNISIILINFQDLMVLSPPDVQNFIESGNSKSKEKSALSWKNKLINFTDEFAKTYQKNYQHLINIFKDINNKSKKNNNEDIVKYFENCQINSNGEIEKALFINMMAKLGIVRDVNFHTLLQTFTNTKTDNFNLIGFLNGYYSFYYKEKEGSVENITNSNISNNEGKDKINLNINKNKNNLTNENTPKILFKNYKRNFRDEDMEYIEEVTQYLVDIILNEKLMGVKEFFDKKDLKKNKYFTRAEFIKILYEDLEIDTEGENDKLQIFYDFLINDKSDENKKLGFEPILIEKIVTVFKSYAEGGIIEMINENSQNNITNNNNNNKSSSNINNNTSTAIGNNNSNNSREEKIISEFSKYLNNNRIKFSTIFPTILTNPNEDTIQIFDFKQAISISQFPIAHDDMEKLIKYFDPYNKMRISIETIKTKIKKYEKDYFEKAFQKLDQNQLNQISKEINNNPRIGNLINLLNEYINNNKLSLQEFFNKFDKNADENISKTEFIQIMINLDSKFVIEDLIDFFNFVDKENNNFITINKFYAYFNSAMMTRDEKKDKVKISEKMMLEIDYLFNHFDLDGDNKISRDDFYKALKSMNNRTTMDDVNIIMKQVDLDGDGFVDRKEFIIIMEENLKQQIIFKEEEKEYFVKLFKEADIDNLYYLTPIQMKHLLLEKLQVNLTNEEVEDLINEVDVNNDGMIDIDEFIKLLGSAENNESLKHTVRQINLKRKINPMTFLNIFNGLPMNFMPSFIKDEQKLFKLLTSDTLRPRTDPTGILFEDILPINNPNNSKNTNNIKENYILRPISTKINTKISFETATGVAIPDENVLNRTENIAGRILKITLFNANKNSFLGNSISIQAKWNKDYEDRWSFEEDRKMFNNNIIIRYNGLDFEFIQVIIEVIILIKKENVITETSCGWSSIELKDLIKPSEIKLQIKGGTPHKNDIISKTDIRTKRNGWAKFAQFFSGEIKSQLPVKIKPFKELNNNDKNLIDFLPSCIVLHRAALHMCVIFRKFIAKQILNNQFYSLKVIKTQHSIINNFCKIVDCPDAYQPMIELWNNIIFEGATSQEKKDENYWENNLSDFVNRIYNVLYSDKFEYNHLDPTELSLGDVNLNNMRNLLINSAIKFDKGKRFNKNTQIEPVENLTSFKPFTINECLGRRIDISSKLDEILPVNERSVSYDFNKSGIDFMTR